MLTLLIIITLTLLILSVILATVQTAFSRITPSRASALRAADDENESVSDQRIKTLEAYAQVPVRVFAPLTLATMLSQFATVATAGYSGFLYGSTASDPTTQQVIWALAAAGLALLALISATVLNSSHALLSPDYTAVRLVPVLKWVLAFRFLTHGIVARIHKRSPAPPVAPDVDEQHLLAIADKADEIGSGEVTMLRRLIEFDNTTVGDIMTHRSDLVALRSGFAIDDALEVAMFNGLSRLPVVADFDDISNVIGGIHIKTLMFAHLVGKGRDDIDIWMSDIPTVPENQQLENLLEDLRMKEFHLAAVIDEHGDLAGVVTLEDVLEELVGEIKDEFDRDSVELVMIEDDIFEVDGRFEVARLAEELNCVVGDTTARTIAGMIFSALGRVPEVGEVYEPENGQVTFTVLQMQGRRIRKIQIELKSKVDMSDTETTEEASEETSPSSAAKTDSDPASDTDSGAATSTAGSDTAGSDTAGSGTVGSDPVGSDPVGSDTVGEIADSND